MGKGAKNVVRQRPSLTEFMPAEQRDYFFPGKRYIAFEGAIVSFLCKQDVIRPNHITYARFVISLLLLCFSPYLSYFQIFILVAFGALTDFFDGALARAASKKTRLGMMIDPLADKFLAFSLIYVLLIRRVIDPIYLFFLLIMESHLVLIPLLSWIHEIRQGRKNHDSTVPEGRQRGVFIIKSREIFLGKIKSFIYALAFLGILAGQAIDSVFLTRFAEGLLIAGIAVGGVALCNYIIRCYKRPYRLSDFQ